MTLDAEALQQPVTTTPDEPESVRLRIMRFDPDRDAAPYFEEFVVPFVRGMRVLDALEHVYSVLEHTFAFRWFCATKRCGQCAVMVNDRPQLACWEPALPEMTVTALRNFPVVRDLVVDFAANEAALTALRPILERSEPYPGFPEPVARAEMRQHERLMSCIDCRICVAACSVVAGPGADDFAGPYALVQLAKIATHVDNGVDLTEQVVAANPEHCQECGDCVDCCPNDIPILTGAINVLRHIDGVPRTDRRAEQPGCGSLVTDK